MGQSSGVGVIDKAVAVLVAVADGPLRLSALTEATGLSRATTHRLGVALEHHHLLARGPDGQWLLGPRIGELAARGPDEPLLTLCRPVLARLRDLTNESAQLYVRRGDARVCVAAAEPRSGLRDTVPVGSVLPMTAGSAAQVLLAFSPAPAGELLSAATFSARTLAEVRHRGWAHSVAEREAGVGSVSAPVLGVDQAVLGAISVSGPLDRLTRNPGRRHAAAVLATAGELSALLGAGGPRRPAGR